MPGDTSEQDLGSVIVSALAIEPERQLTESSVRHDAGRFEWMEL